MAMVSLRLALVAALPPDEAAKQIEDGLLDGLVLCLECAFSQYSAAVWLTCCYYGSSATWAILCGTEFFVGCLTIDEVDQSCGFEHFYN